MELHLLLQGKTDLSGQVYRGIAGAIDDGRLKPGQQLPPSRLLAAQPGISRKPVAQAYARLTYERLIIGQIGKGSFVSGRAAPAAVAPERDVLEGSAALARFIEEGLLLKHIRRGAYFCASTHFTRVCASASVT